MNLLERDGPILYIYCLVDPVGERFKLGLTPHKHYALSFLIAYCPRESFQVGYPAEYAKVGWDVLTKNYAEQHIASNESGDAHMWLPLTCFEEVRVILNSGQHTVAPIQLVMVDPERTKALAQAEIERILFDGEI